MEKQNVSLLKNAHDKNEKGKKRDVDEDDSLSKKGKKQTEKSNV